jgi:hypothetical protein
MVDLVKTILPTDRRISDLEQLKAFIDEFCASRDRKVISLALAVLGLPEKDSRAYRKRWEKELKRPLDRFAPYATHVFKVDLLFYLGIARGFISGDRASNKADMAYLYYLPCSTAFASGDGLHRRTVPLFLDDDQFFPARERAEGRAARARRALRGAPRAHQGARRAQLRLVPKPGVVPQARWELGNLARLTGEREARSQFDAAIAVAEGLDDIASAAYCELALAELDAEDRDVDAALERDGGTTASHPGAVPPDRRSSHPPAAALVHGGLQRTPP